MVTWMGASAFSEPEAQSYTLQSMRSEMRFGLIRIRQHNGLDGILRERANAFSSHKDWKPGNPGRN